MSHPLLDPPVTIAEYEAFMERQPHDTRWELLDGHILAMTNPTEAHALIAVALAQSLTDSARAKGCRVTVGGVRVQAAAGEDDHTATIPDVLVRCGPRVDRNWIDDPVVVVEVLSPSTMDFDRGAKLDFYKARTSMADIVLIYQDQVRVEHYRRDGDGWAMLPLTRLSDTLVLDSLSAPVELASIYIDTASAD